MCKRLKAKNSLLQYGVYVVLEKFTNLVCPLLRLGKSEIEISEAITKQVVDRILELIEDEGYSDIVCGNQYFV